MDLLTPYRFTVDGVERNIGFRGGLLGHWCVWTKKAVELFEKVKHIQGQDCIPADLLTQAAELTDINGAFFDAAHELEDVSPDSMRYLGDKGSLKTHCVWIQRRPYLRNR